MLKTTARFCLLLLCWVNLTTMAQEFPFVSVNNRIDLPSLECYNILQDKTGAIWIGTEKGLLRYNGNSTKKFDQHNGLPEKSVYASIERYGKLWFATSKNRILNYQNGELKEVKASASYQNRLGKPYSPNLTYALSVQQDKIYLIAGQSLYQMDTTGTQLEQLHPSKGNAISLKQTEDGLVPINTSLKQYYEIPTKKMFSIPLEFNISGGPNGNKTFRPSIQRHVNGAEWRILSAKTQKFFFLSFYNKVLKFDIELKTFDMINLPAPVISLYTDTAGGLWVGTIRQGLYYYNFAEHNPIPIISLSNSSVSGIIRDREGSIWCTTLEDGVFMLRNKQVVGYQNLSGQFMAPTMLQTVNNKLWISTPGYGLQYFDAQTNRFVPVDEATGHGYYHIWEHNKQLYLSSETGVLKYHSNGRKSKGEKYGSISSLIVRGSTLLPSGDLYTITYDRILHTQAGTGKRSLVAKLGSIGRSIAYTAHGKLLYGCSDGLYLYDIKSTKISKLKGVYNDVPQILRASDGKIWICTAGEGLFTYHNGRLELIRFPPKIKTNTFNWITQDHRGDIWAATNAGLVKIKERNGRLEAESYGTNDGLPSNKIFRVAAVGDQLFFSNFSGLFSIPLSNSIKNNIPPLLSLSSISDGKKTIAGKINLPYNNNKLELEFNVGQYSSDDYRIGYTLHPEQAVTYVKGNTVSLQHLAPGNYQFRAFSLSGEGMRSAETVSLNFSVLQPLWLRWWFLAGMLLLITLTIWFIKNRQVERIKKRQAELNRINSLIADSKLTALQARMNPHFIFNAINSIQNYIYKNRSDDAHHYLTKFSRLIRLILQQSAEKFITLDRELEALRLYIELEQLRFRNRFSYQITLAPEISEQTTYMPTMLIQPYVENAIWHGLMHLDGERKGELTIGISGDSQHLTITIRDNGIGRQRAGSLQKERLHIPAGMMLTEDRLKVLRELYGNLRFQVVVTDMYNTASEPTGTSVEISLSIPTPAMIY